MVFIPRRIQLSSRLAGLDSLVQLRGMSINLILLKIAVGNPLDEYQVKFVGMPVTVAAK